MSRERHLTMGRKIPLRQAVQDGGHSYFTLYRWIRAGILPGYQARPAATIYVDEDELEEVLTRRVPVGGDANHAA